MAKNTLQKSSSTKKEFGYSNGEVSLNFTLIVDNEQQVNAFRECLIEALKDVEETIEIIKG